MQNIELADDQAFGDDLMGEYQDTRRYLFFGLSKLSPWVLQLELDAENNKPGFSERKWYELHEKASLALRPTLLL